MKRISQIGFFVILAMFLLLCLATGLGALAPWIEADTFSWIQLLPTAFVIFIFLHLFALIYFVRKSWKWAFVAMAGIALCAWVISRDITLNKAKTENSALIKVLSYNVGTFDYKTENINAAVNLLKSMQPDIISFQEFRNHKLGEDIYAIEYMAEALDMPHYQFVHLPVHIHGSVVYSRYPISRIDTLFMQEAEINSGFLSTIETPIGRIGIGNLHLSSFQVSQTLDKASGLTGKMGALYKRSKRVVSLQKDKVNRVLKTTDNYAYPMVITGDWNASPHTNIVAPFRKRFVDSFRAAGNGLGWTYPVWGPLGLRIDYQFASQELSVLDHQVVKSLISDHYAIMASYTIQP